MNDHRSIPALAQLLLLLMLALLGASRSVSAQTSATLTPGDVLKITVYGNADLTTVTRVSPAGTITFPLIGQVAVGGRSPFEAEEAIADRLRRGGFVTNATVGIFVQERGAVPGRTVTLLGQVDRSGNYSIDQESADGVATLIELLAKGGGVTDKAADYCYLIRYQNGQSRKIEVDLVDLLRNGNVDANIVLNDGDFVLVPEMDVFYIYGEVQRPGRYKLERDMTVMQGLSVASGMTPRGSVKGIVINRQEAGKIQSVESGLETRLQSNDVVYVKTTVF